MSSLQSLVMERKYPEILKECELLELQGNTVIQLLVLIITNNLTEARFLIKRTNVRSPLFTHLIGIVNNLWTMNYQFEYINVDHEEAMVKELYSQMKEQIKEEIKTSFRAYESVELDILKQYMEEGEIAAFGRVSDGYVYPKPVTVESTRDYNVVEQLSDYIVGLRY
ncbi:hypothetical protein HDV04_003032 [Boothiomyces sp. JEL0838]|nr:hypothetical protein HDV04_003032 [Boothiomyces sp. JEL0838]